MPNIVAWCKKKNTRVNYNEDEVIQQGISIRRFKREIKCKECGETLYLDVTGVGKGANGVSIIQSTYRHH